MNGYICFDHRGHRWECRANTAYEAQQKAIEHFKPPKSKRHMVHVHLAEKDGEQVVHKAVD